jgi:hypothetical protein
MAEKQNVRAVAAKGDTVPVRLARVREIFYDHHFQ